MTATPADLWRIRGDFRSEKRWFAAEMLRVTLLERMFERHPVMTHTLYCWVLGRRPWAMTCDAPGCYSIQLVGWRHGKDEALGDWTRHGHRTYCPVCS